MTPVKNDDAETARDQFGESADHAGRVGELKFGSSFADRRYLAFVHEHNNSFHDEASVAIREKANPLAQRARSSLIISAAKQLVRRKR
jgi:hypothetical protein